MLKQQIESLMADLSKVIPNDLEETKSEIESNIRASLIASFSKLDLVTREEFDIQSELLKRSRAKLEQLEQQISELEEKL